MRQENEKTVINIADQFSDFPAGGNKKTNEYSANRFRDEFLMPPLIDNKIVEVDFYNMFACPPYFMDEAFGGLIRKNKGNQKIIKKIIEHLTFKENNDVKYDGFNNLAKKYIEKALIEIQR